MNRFVCTVSVLLVACGTQSTLRAGDAAVVDLATAPPPENEPIATTEDLAHDTPDEVPFPEGYAASFPRFKASDLQRDVLLMYVAEPCGMLESHSARLEALTTELGLHDLVVAGDYDAVEQVGAGRYTVGTGSIVVLRNGLVEDLVKGDYPVEMYLHFFARNDLIADGPRYYNWRDGYDWAKDIPLNANKYHTAMNFEGRDLRDFPFYRGEASGANLRNTDLRGVDMRYANLSRSDLTGARLDDAQTENVRWFGATCPDGTQANDHEGRTCDGHLQRRK